MAAGERIRFIRNLRGMTQKFLGIKVGFPEKTADVRMAQYESGTRTPKVDLTTAIANALDVSPQALEIPDIASDLGLMHTFFALEDIYGLRAGEIDGEVCLRLDKVKGRNSAEVAQMLCAWQQQVTKLEAGQITKEEYDEWRYKYPEFDTTRIWAKIPSQDLSDWLNKKLDK